MKRLLTRGVLFAVPLLLLALPAAAGTGSAVRAKPVHARTLVVEKGAILSFAQDGNAISWIGPHYRVHVRSLSAHVSSIVGSAAPPVGIYGPTPTLALAGTRALWTKAEGGNAPYSSLLTSSLGDKAIVIDGFMGGSGDPYSLSLAGAAGDGPTLLYGKTLEDCPDHTCQTLVASGGVSLVTGQYEAPPISGIPAPAMLAFSARDPQSHGISQGLLAVAPAASPLLRATPLETDFGIYPRVAENGPVQVYRLLNKVVLVSSIVPRGTVKAIAVSFQGLVVLVQRPEGTKAIERYNPNSGALIDTTSVPKGTASELSVSQARVVYRVGSRIYLLGTGQPKLVWRANGTPIGLSIEGNRIAWAANVNRRGRIVALTLR